MKIHLIRKESIEDYARANARSKPSFAIWLTTIKHVEWETPSDIKLTFGSADLLGNGCNRVVFNIGGNNYRMICKYAFGEKRVHLFVCWIGTHSEYDKLCDSTEQYTINEF